MTESHRPRVLLVTRNLPPLVGGMERLNWHMAEELAKAAEVRIVGPDGSAALAPAGIEVREAPLKPLWKFLVRARALARREARTWKPDVVLAGSGLTAPLARAAARTCGAKTAVYVHGLDIAVKNRVYRASWLPAIRRADRVIANSRATAELCRNAGVDPARIGIVHPGVDLPRDADSAASHASGHSGAGPQGRNPESVTVLADSLTKPIPGSAHAAHGQTRNDEPGVALARNDGPVSDAGDPSIEFRSQHNLANLPLLLSVGRLSARKGLREFVAQCLPRIVAVHPDAMLLVVGDAPTQALHAEAQTPASIQAAADSAGVGECVRFLGKVPDDELTELYRAASVHVFPVREIPGDPEGFGMVAVEAAAHGLPTVAFAVGGVPDAVVEGETGSLIQSGDYAAFAGCVDAWLARDDHLAVAAKCVEVAARFSWGCFGTKLRTMLFLATANVREKS
ncbi:MAG: glycosyltransferase [Xanthomonadales bacterium]|nr:glycosyltransferase [Xanthomonadales bacterium]ODU92477.1 MAG: glycosyl transferase [Rhodanobacter sp. SCN 66-43]OJY86546.1 MAG: glycosyl transferase [Xanthomonadales bacterium 66-474]